MSKVFLSRYNLFRNKASGDIKDEQLNRALSNIAQVIRNVSLKHPSRDQNVPPPSNLFKGRSTSQSTTSSPDELL
jgi:hypothetical protein